MIADLVAAQVLILDANLLLLFLVGSLDRQLIGKHKRTRNYAPEDFDLLRKIVATKRGVLTTPNVLTEVSNLASQIEGTSRRRLLTALSDLCTVFDERYTESIRATKNPCFSRLGLTDAVLVTACVSEGFLLTDDLDLFLEATRVGGLAANFNHLRLAGWQVARIETREPRSRGAKPRHLKRR